MSGLQKKIAWLFWGWVVVFFILAGLQWQKGFLFNADLMALLPIDTHSTIKQRAQERLLEANGNRLVVLLQSSDVQRVENAASQLHATLCRKESVFDCASVEQTFDLDRLIGTLKGHRAYLISERDRLLISTQPHKVLQHQLTTLFGLKPSQAFLPFDQDPFGFFTHFLNEKIQMLAPYEPKDGYFLLPEHAGLFQAFLLLRLSGDDVDLKTQRQFSSIFDAAVDQLNTDYPDVRLYRSGAIFHAIKATRSAKSDIQLISALSIIGIVALFLLSGLGLVALCFSLFTIGCGFLFALVGCMAIFGSVHVLTLVFGASLLGVAIDYALHFYCHRYAKGAGQRLSGLLPALTLSVLSTCLAFLVLAEAPMLLLKQIAVFSSIGLFGAFLTVIFVLPKVALTPRRIHLLPVIRVLKHGWFAIKPLSLLILLIIVSLSLYSVGTKWAVTTDMRHLLNTNDALIAEEQQVQKSLNAVALNQYILVSAESTDSLMEKEKQIFQVLDQEKAGGRIDGFISLSQWLPDTREQRKNQQLQLGLLDKQGRELFLALGAPQDSLTALIHALKSQQMLSMAELIKAIPSTLQSLYLGEQKGKKYSMILLQGVTSTHALNQIDLPGGAYFVDKIKDISTQLVKQQHTVHTYLLIAYGVIFLLLLLRFRRVSALMIAFVPFVSSLLTLGILLACGVKLSIFHSFALFLILGLGLDYAIFLFTHRNAEETTMLATETAISLSVITSCFAFGLLALSQTTMISALGWTILLGSVFNLLFCPWAIFFTTKIQEK